MMVPIVERLSPRTTARGFTLTELMIVIAVIGVLLGIAVPSFVYCRTTAQAKLCLEIQKTMEGAKAQAAFDNHWDAGVSYHTLGGSYQVILADYLQSGAGMSHRLSSKALRPICPTGAEIFWNGIGENVACQSGLETHVLRR